MRTRSKNQESMKKFVGRLKTAMALRDVSQIELARRCGVTTAAVSQWVNGQSSPSLARVEQIAAALNVKVDTLVTTDELAVKKSTLIPILSEVTYPLTLDNNVVGYEEILSDLLIRGEYFALKIYDDKMYPEMKTGDTAIVRITKEIPSNAIAVVSFDGRCFVRKVHEENGGVIVVGYNLDTCMPRFLTDAQFVGLVVEIRRKLI